MSGTVKRTPPVSSGIMHVRAAQHCRRCDCELSVVTVIADEWSYSCEMSNLGPPNPPSLVAQYFNTAYL